MSTAPNFASHAYHMTDTTQHDADLCTTLCHSAYTDARVYSGSIINEHQNAEHLIQNAIATLTNARSSVAV